MMECYGVATGAPMGQACLSQRTVLCSCQTLRVVKLTERVLRSSRLKEGKDASYLATLEVQLRRLGAALAVVVAEALVECEGHLYAQQVPQQLQALHPTAPNQSAMRQYNALV